MPDPFVLRHRGLHIGDEVLIRQSCILTESTVADGAKIGPFAHLRPGSEIGEEAHVGNFVETKKAKLGKGAKANHLTYLGDAEVGEGTNIGAGVITCNYDGVHKHPTRIGKGVFVGSDSTLVAPIAIEDGAYIGAASCITREVPAGALAVGPGAADHQRRMGDGAPRAPKTKVGMIATPGACSASSFGRRPDGAVGFAKNEALYRRATVRYEHS